VFTVIIRSATDRLLRLTVVVVMVSGAVTVSIPPARSHAASVGDVVVFPNVMRGAITAGPDGNLWGFGVECYCIARTTTGGSVTSYRLASEAPVHFIDITAGPDGNLWFLKNPDIHNIPPPPSTIFTVGRVTLNGVITEFPLPTLGQFPASITPGPDGNVWFTEQFVQFLGQPANIPLGQIGRITPQGTITEFPLAVGDAPGDITAGPDGNLWFGVRNTAAGSAGGYVARMTPTGVLTKFPLPSGGFADAITAGPDGNLWFGGHGSFALGRMSTSGVFTAFVTTYNSIVVDIATGPDGNLWFTEPTRLFPPRPAALGTRVIGRITTSGVLQEFSLDQSYPQLGILGHIAPGPGGNMWFTTSQAELGYIVTGASSTLSADLSIIKSASPNPVAAGSNLTYTLAVTNRGPSAATGVTLNDTLPSGVTFVSMSATQGNCTGTATVNCSLGVLANGAAATVTITVRATGAGSVTNTASVAGNQVDANLTNNSASSATTVSCVLSDPLVPQQWNLRQIHLTDALATFASCSPPPVNIGIVDTGVNLTHPDLAGRITRAVSARGSDVTDRAGHGTEVTGIVGANSNNGVGIAGIASTSHLFIYKHAATQIFGGLLAGADSIRQTTSLIRRAVDDGVRVINLSFGSARDPRVRPPCILGLPSCKGELELAVEYAAQHGVLIVAATSEGRNSAPNQTIYPAAYSLTHSNVIAVTASTPDGAVASYSTAGPYVTLAAPGGSGGRCGPADCIWTLSKDGDFVQQTGTSYAAPHVTAVAALMLAANPTLTPEAVRRILRDTATPFTSDIGRPGGSGVVNAEAAVLRAKSEALR